MWHKVKSVFSGKKVITFIIIGIIACFINYPLFSFAQEASVTDDEIKASVDENLNNPESKEASKENPQELLPPLDLQNITDINSVKYDVRDTTIFIYFKTKYPVFNYIGIRDENDKSIENLKIYDISLDAPSHIPNKKATEAASKFPETKLVIDHYILVAGLTPSTKYKGNIIIGSDPGYNEIFGFEFTTPSNETSLGTFEFTSELGLISDPDAQIIVSDFFASNPTPIKDLDGYCKKLYLNQEMCKAAIEENDLAVSYSDMPSERAGEKDSQINTIAEIFENKWVLYGDIALIVFVLILELVYLAKSRKPWGIIFDSKTKQPVQGAVVRSFAEEKNKIIETKVTDKDGRYNVLVKPGSYYLTVTKDNYTFPSKLITKKDDEFYSNMYRGEVLKIFKGEAALTPNIPIDPVGQTQEEVVKEWKQLSNFKLKFTFFLLNRLRIILLLILTVFHAGIVLLYYTSPILTSAILIGVAWLIEIYIVLRKGYR